MGEKQRGRLAKELENDVGVGIVKDALNRIDESEKMAMYADDEEDDDDIEEGVALISRGSTPMLLYVRLKALEDSLLNVNLRRLLDSMGRR